MPRDAIVEVGDDAVRDAEAWFSAEQALVAEEQNDVFTITLDKPAPRLRTCAAATARQWFRHSVPRAWSSRYQQPRRVRETG